MAGMKISLDSAMRARDVSHPRAADEAAAERTEVAVSASNAGSGARPALTGQASAPAADVESIPAGQSRTNGPEKRAARAATGRNRERRRRPAPADAVTNAKPNPGGPVHSGPPGRSPPPESPDHRGASAKPGRLAMF